METVLTEFWQASIRFSTGHLYLRLVIAILATWRVASLLTNEDGPWLIFWRLRLRFRVGDKQMRNFAMPGDAKRTAERPVPVSTLAGLLECLWCTSVWVSVAVFVLALSPTWWLLWPLAISAGAIWLDAIANR